MNKELFTDGEKGKLFALCQDTAMMDAIKKVMLQDIYAQGSNSSGSNSRNFIFNIVNGNTPTGQSFEKPAKSDEQIGQETRAMISALQLLETAFARIKDFDVKPIDTTPKPNPAL